MPFKPSSVCKVLSLGAFGPLFVIHASVESSRSDIYFSSFMSSLVVVLILGFDVCFFLVEMRLHMNIRANAFVKAAFVDV